MTLADNIAGIEQRIARAAEAAGRRPDEITLVAVSKTHGPDKIAEAAGRNDEEMVNQLLEQRILVDRELVSLSRK